MKTFIYSIGLLLFSINIAQSQNTTDAQTITKNLLLHFKTTTIKTDFELTTFEKNKLNSHSNHGTFTMKGEQFVIEMPEIKVWYDGKTQWSFMTQTNEVSIIEPNEEEILEINPLAILNKYAAKSKIAFSKKKSKDFHIIDITANESNDDIIKIETQINKNSKQLKSIEITDKNGIKTVLNLKNYEDKLKLGTDFFKFDKQAYKNVYINDLR